MGTGNNMSTSGGTIMGSAITAIKNQSKLNKAVAAALAAMLTLAVAAVGLAPAFAADGDIAGGTVAEDTGAYGIDWRIDSDGVLILGSNSEKQTVNTPWNNTSGNSAGGAATSWPWYTYRTQITGVKIADGGIDVGGTGAINYMFTYIGTNTPAKFIDLTGFDTSNVTQIRALFSNTRAEEINLSDCDFSKVGSIGTSWAQNVLNAFLNTEFDKMVLPSYTGGTGKYTPGSANFFSGTGISGKNTENWIKIADGDNNPIAYNGAGSVTKYTTTQVAGRLGDNLKGTWMVESKVTQVDIIKQDPDGYELRGAKLHFAGGSENIDYTYTTKRDGLLTYNLPAGEYTLEELTAPDGYVLNTGEVKFTVKDDGTVTDADGNAIADNKVIMKNYPYGDVTVTKVWDDDSNAANKRPTEDVVLVLDSGLKDENEEEITYTTGENYTDAKGGAQTAGAWETDQKDSNKKTYTFKDLPLYNPETGEKLAYTVDEPDQNVPDGYVKSVYQNSLTVTNTSIDKKQDITVTKTWNDSAEEATRRPSITLRLKGGSEERATGNYDSDNGDVDPNWNIPDGSNTWTYTFKDLRVYDDDGNTISYELTEDPISGYSNIVDGMRIVNNSGSVEAIKPPVPKQDGEKATYTQQSTPDRIQTFGQNNDEPEDTTNITNKMFEYVVDNYDTQKEEYFMPTKDAVWTDDAKEHADIIMSYKEPIHPIYFFGTLCNAHGLTADRMIAQIEAVAKEGDVHYILEGIDYLPEGSYTDEAGVTWDAYYKSGTSTQVETDDPIAGTVERNGNLPDKVKDQIREELKDAGQHATIRKFAQDIVDNLKDLSDEEKPAQIILSFDYWAWAACAASLEGEMDKDIALMRQAASILQEYYEDGKVIWLSGTGDAEGLKQVGDKYIAKISTDFSNNVITLGNNARPSWTYYLYPDDAQDFVDNPKAVPSDTTTSAFTDQNAFRKYIVDSYKAGTKYTTTFEWAEASQRVWKGSNGTNNGAAADENWKKFRSIEKIKNYYTLSKRMAFYQYALLNPAMFLKVTQDDNPLNWDIPHIDDWMLATYNGQPWREYVETLSYGSNDTAAKLAEKNKQYNRYTITDTLNDGLVIAPDNSSEPPVEFWYYTGDLDEGDLVDIKRENYASDEAYQEAYDKLKKDIKDAYADTENNWEKLTFGTDYIFTPDEGRKSFKIETTGTQTALDSCNKRIKIVVHTECKENAGENEPFLPIYVEDFPLKQGPRDTNNDAEGKLTFKTTHVDDASEEVLPISTVTVDTPQLRKSFPRTIVSVTKQWKDATGKDAKPQDEVILRIHKVDKDGNVVKKDVLPAQRISIDPTKPQTVTWGDLKAYTASDGTTEVTELQNALHRYEDDKVSPNNEIAYVVEEEYVDSEQAKHFITTTTLVQHGMEHKANQITELETEGYVTLNEEKPKVKITKVWKNDEPDMRPDELTTKLLVKKYKAYEDAVTITTAVYTGDAAKGAEGTGEGAKDGTFTIVNTYTAEEDNAITSWVLKNPNGDTVASGPASGTIAKDASESVDVKNAVTPEQTHGFEFAGCTLEVEFADGNKLSYVLQQGTNNNVEVPMTVKAETKDDEIILVTDGWTKPAEGATPNNEWTFEKELDFAASTFESLHAYEIEPSAYNYVETSGYTSKDSPVVFTYQKDGDDAGYYTATLTNEHRAAQVKATKVWEDFDNAYNTRDEIQMHLDVKYITTPPTTGTGEGTGEGSGDSGEGGDEGDGDGDGEGDSGGNNGGADDGNGSGDSGDDGSGTGDDASGTAEGADTGDGTDTNETAGELREKEDVLPAQKIAVDATSLTVIWGDGKDYSSTQVDDTITVYKTVKDLYNALNPGTDPDAEEITFTFDFEKWQYKDSKGNYHYVNELPSYDENGVKITYVIRETDKDGNAINETDASAALVGYTTEVGEMKTSGPDSKGIITHSGTVTNKLETTSFTVTKKWYDAKADNAHSEAEIQNALQLSNQSGVIGAATLKTAEGTKPAPQKLETTPANGKTFTTTWTNLPKYIKVGNSVVEAQYSVTENAFAGYATTYKNEDNAATEGVDESSEKSKALNGGTIINNQLVNVKVTKVWDDADNQDGKRPTSLDVTLQKGSGAAVADDVATNDTPTHTLPESTKWETTWAGLPYANEDGQKIDYGVAEATTGLVAAGYIAGEVQDKGYNADTKTYSFEVTNTHEPATIQIKVVKKWDDADNQDGKRNGISADLTLYKKVAGSNSEQVLTGNDETAGNPVAYNGQKVLGTTADGATVVTWMVPVYEAGQVGKVITYRVAEASIDDYTTTYAVTGSSASPATTDGSVDASTVAVGGTATVTITNKHETEKTSVTITKTWDDAKYFTGEAATLTNGANGYSRPDVTFILVGKTTDTTWDGTSQDVVLGATDVNTAKSDTNDSTWKKTISGLPKYHDGLEITYTATEKDAPDGFTKQNENATARSAENKPVDKSENENLELIIKKIDGATGHALEGATFTVKKAGETVGTVSPTVTQPSVDATARFTFTEDGIYTISETTTPTGYDKAADVTVKVEKSLKSITLEDDTSGDPVTKFFKWLYELFFGTGNNDMPATYVADTNTLTIANQPKTASISVNKAWEDGDDQDGLRAAAANNLPKVTLQKTTATEPTESDWVDLDADDVAVPANNGLVKTGSNTFTWNNLPAYEDGKKLTYRVTEIDQITGYTADFDASQDGAQDEARLTLYNADTNTAQSGTATVTNSYTPETASISVEKVWNDGNNQDGTRPSNLTFTLEGKYTVNGTEKSVTIPGGQGADTKTYNTDKTVADNTAIEAVATWSNLPVYQEGVKVVYTVTESTNDSTKQLTGVYSISYNGNDTELKKTDTKTIKVTNTYTPKTTSLTIKKTWNDTTGKYADLFKANGDPVASYERPAVTVKVKGVYTDDDGDEQTVYAEKTVTLTGETKKDTTVWTADTLTNLPVFVDGGKQVKYIVTEAVPEGYTVTGENPLTLTPTSNDNGATYTLANAEFTNTPILKEANKPLALTILKVEKGATTGLSGATFGLYADSACTTAVEASKAAISGATGDDGKATVTFKEPGTYYIKETKAPTGYTASDAVYTVVVEKGGIVSVTKKTSDENPPSTWFERLYELVFGSTTTNLLDRNSSTLKVENELMTADLTVTKTWDDSGNQDGKRTAATLQLQKKVGNGNWANVAGKTGTVQTDYTSAKTTVTTFTGLPAYEGGQVVKYRVTETTVADYDATYDAGDDAYEKEGEGVDLLSSSDITGNTTANKSIDTKNTYKPKTVDISIAKKWNDASNQDGKRSSNSNAIVTLQKKTDGDWTDVTFTTAADNGVKVPQTDGTVKEWKNLPAYEGGALITYRVVETGLNSEYAIEKYEGGAGTSKNEVVYAPADGEKTTKALTVTNKYPAESASVKVVKVWNDANNQDGKRVGSIDFKLVGSDGTNKTETVTVSTTAADGAEAASHTWTNLPIYKNGSKITYTVTEETTIEGYAAPAYTGTDAAKKNAGFELAKNGTYEVKVTNSYTPKLVDISVNKKWDDSSNKYKLRANNAAAKALLEKSTDGKSWAKVTGTGIANDVAVPQTDGQIAQWTNLPAYEGGKLITYRVSESGLASMYTAAYTGGTGSANNEFAYSGAAAKASAAMTVTNTCDYDADPPTDTGETFKGRYTSNGSDQSQDWTPSDWISEIKTYATQPDGSPNEIDGFTLVDANGNEVTTLTTDEGTYVIDPQTGKVTFTPAPGFTQGKASTVTVRAKDKVGAITGKYPQATYTPEVVDNKQEATAVRNITYTYLTADGTEASKTVQQTVKLVRYGTVDEIAKTVSYEGASWQPADDANKDFPAQTSPAIEGWKASGNAAGQTPNPSTDVQVVYDEVTNTFVYPDLHVLYVPQNAGTDERTTTDGKFTSVGGLQEQKSGSFTNLTDKLTTKTLPDGSANTITGYALIDPETGEEVPGGTLVIEGEGTYTIDPATGEVTFVPDKDFPGGAATRVEVRAKDKLSAVLDETVATLQGRISNIDEELADIDEQLAALDEAADGYEEQKAALEAQKTALAEEQATARAQVEEYSNYQVPLGFYTPNVVLNAETATPSRTITYTYYTVDGDQVQENVVQTLEFTRYGTYNPETGEVEYDSSTWIAKDGKDTFDAVNSPIMEATGGTGWHTDTEVVPALRVTDPTKPIEDEHVVYTPTGGTAVEDYWVTYIDPATGRVIQEKIYQPKTTAEPPAPADPTRDGYTFDGWDREVDADGNITYKAKWVPVSTPEPPAPINWVRYIDSDGSTVYLPQTDWTIGTTEPAAPEDPTKDGYVFDGWDRTVDEDGNVTYIAKWKPAITPEPEPEPEPQPSPTPTPSPSPQPSVRTTPVPTSTSASGVAVQATPKTADSAPYVPAAVVLMASAAAMALSCRRLQEACLAPAASAAARAGKPARKEQVANSRQ